MQLTREQFEKIAPLLPRQRGTDAYRAPVKSATSRLVSLKVPIDFPD
ncbi:hypothetical protein [Burkholderia vietnamiensis]|nr:hypothetical protein [Burkholderia vietnamiensis]